MHHIGLSHSPFQQNRRILSPTSGSFASSRSPGGGRSGDDFGVDVEGDEEDDEIDTTDTGTGTEDGDGDTEEEDGEGEGEEKEKEALIERLSELVERLKSTSEGEIGEDVLREVRGEVDRIERVVEDGMREMEKGRERRVGNGMGMGSRMRLDEIGRLERESYGGVDRSPSPSPSPVRKVQNSRRISRLGKGKTDTPQQAREEGSASRQMENGHKDIIPREEHKEMSPSQATEIARQAEELAEALGATVAELIARKEESDQIHDLLVTRSSQATERILLLEYRIAEMEDDFSANQSELKFLRIQLQALEAQCSPYIPSNEDEELSESIMNWKIDWEDINRRSRARRRRSAGLQLGEDGGQLSLLDVERPGGGLKRLPSEEVRLRGLGGLRVVQIAGGGHGGGLGEVVDVG